MVRALSSCGTSAFKTVAHKVNSLGYGVRVKDFISAGKALFIGISKLSINELAKAYAEDERRIYSEIESYLPNRVSASLLVFILHMVFYKKIEMERAISWIEKNSLNWFTYTKVIRHSAAKEFLDCHVPRAIETFPSKRLRDIYLDFHIYAESIKKKYSAIDMVDKFVDSIMKHHKYLYCGAYKDADIELYIRLHKEP